MMQEFVCDRCGQTYKQHYRFVPLCRRCQNKERRLREYRKKEGFHPIEKSQRNDEIIQARIDGKTMQEIASQFGISRERVRQILVISDVALVTPLETRAQKLYEFIISYKMEHDGNTPPAPDMLTELHLSTLSRLRNAYDLLERQGKIRRVGKGKHDVVVIGAKWLPPPDWKDDD